MSDEYFLLCLSLVLVTAMVLFGLWLRHRNLQEHRRMIRERRRVALTKVRESAPLGVGRPEQPLSSWGSESDDRSLGAWVPDLLDSLGVDPDVLFADEIPPELSSLLPMVRGFVKQTAEQQSRKQSDDEQWL